MPACLRDKNSDVITKEEVEIVPISMRCLAVVCVLLMTLVVSGCGMVGDGPFGWVMTYTTVPVAKGPLTSGNRNGQACIYSVFGAISMGDGSIEAAIRNGGITGVYTIDLYNQSFFGVYTRQCTVVVGQ
ncbi:TRL-like protein family [Candidatus Magnetobacterium bavaricum]|uniref:TRL-like protein family n=1 Tax=Candidatus Magnetobacterium bavaricum TaxID=29290 RepID=A0A0F3GTA0_9BACT|nr:TRL-like protein family [Candidatus Magnetobacterium bavaricum]